MIVSMLILLRGELNPPHHCQFNSPKPYYNSHDVSTFRNNNFRKFVYHLENYIKLYKTMDRYLKIIKIVTKIDVVFVEVEIHGLLYSSD